jgi:hypothetical protein
MSNDAATTAKSRLKDALDAADRKYDERQQQKQDVQDAYKMATDNFTELRTKVIEPTFADYRTDIEARGHRVAVERPKGDPIASVNLIIRPKHVAAKHVAALPDERMPSLSFEFCTIPLGAVAVQMRNISPVPEERNRAWTVASPSEITAETVGDLIIELVEKGVTKGVF